jgi:N2227-like protein
MLSVHSTVLHNVNTNTKHREVRLPDISTREALASVIQRLAPDEQHNFCMTAGEWLEVYRNQEGVWDSIVTCFFLVCYSIVMHSSKQISRAEHCRAVLVTIATLSDFAVPVACMESTHCQYMYTRFIMVGCLVLYCYTCA